MTQGVKELALSLIQLWLQLRLRFDFWAENFLMSQVQPKKEREREREGENLTFSLHLQPAFKLLAMHTPVLQTRKQGLSSASHLSPSRPELSTWWPLSIWNIADPNREVSTCKIHTRPQKLTTTTTKWM